MHVLVVKSKEFQGLQKKQSGDKEHRCAGNSSDEVACAADLKTGKWLPLVQASRRLRRPDPYKPSLLSGMAGMGERSAACRPFSWPEAVGMSSEELRASSHEGTEGD